MRRKGCHQPARKPSQDPSAGKIHLTASLGSDCPNNLILGPGVASGASGDRPPSPGPRNDPAGHADLQAATNPEGQPGWGLVSPPPLPGCPPRAMPPQSQGTMAQSPTGPSHPLAKLQRRPNSRVRHGFTGPLGLAPPGPQPLSTFSPDPRSTPAASGRLLHWYPPPPHAAESTKPACPVASCTRPRKPLPSTPPAQDPDGPGLPAPMSPHGVSSQGSPGLPGHLPQATPSAARRQFSPTGRTSYPAWSTPVPTEPSQPGLLPQAWLSSPSSPQALPQGPERQAPPTTCLLSHGSLHLEGLPPSGLLTRRNSHSATSSQQPSWPDCQLEPIGGSPLGLAALATPWPP